MRTATRMLPTERVAAESQEDVGCVVSRLLLKFRMVTSYRTIGWRRPAIVVGCGFGVLLVVTGCLFLASSACEREEYIVRLEPVWNRALRASGWLGATEWRYLASPPYNSKCGAPQATGIGGFDRQGRLVIAQSTGMFDPEDLLRYAHRRAELPIFENLRLTGFSALLGDRGQICTLASDRLCEDSGVSMGGVDALDSIATSDPQQHVESTSHRWLYFHPADVDDMYRTVLGGNGGGGFWIERRRGEASWIRVGGAVSGTDHKPEGLWLRGFHPVDPRIVFAKCSFGGGSPHSYLESRDKGEHFEIIGTADEFSLFAISRSQPAMRYRIRLGRTPDGLGYQKALERTKFGSDRDWMTIGGDWMFAPLRVRNEELRSRVRGIAVHPANPGIVLLASSRGLLRSMDYGKTWELLNLGIPNAETVNGVIFDSANPDAAYVSTMYGLFRSPDAGSTWRQLDLVRMIGEDAFRRMVQLKPDGASKDGRVLRPNE